MKRASMFYLTFKMVLLVSLFAPLFPNAGHCSSWIDLTTKKIASPPLHPPELTITHKEEPSGQKSIHIQLTIFSVQKTTLRYGNTDYTSLYIEGLGPYQMIGAPDILSKSIFLEIPENSDTEIEVITSQWVELNSILLAPVQPPPLEASTESQNGFAIDEKLYGSKQPFPKTPILSAKNITIRDKNLLELRLSPLQFIPWLQTVRISTYMEIVVKIK